MEVITYANVLKALQVKDVTLKCNRIHANLILVKTVECVPHNQLAVTEWVVLEESRANVHQDSQVNVVKITTNHRIHVNQILVKTLDDVCNQQMGTNANAQLDMEVEIANNKIYAM